MATICNTLHHATTHCNPLPVEDKMCQTTSNTLQHATTYCNTLQHAATRCNTIPFGDKVLQKNMQHIVTRSKTLQHATAHCNTLPVADRRSTRTYHYCNAILLIMKGAPNSLHMILLHTCDSFVLKHNETRG